MKLHPASKLFELAKLTNEEAWITLKIALIDVLISFLLLFVSFGYFAGGMMASGIVGFFAQLKFTKAKRYGLAYQTMLYSPPDAVLCVMGKFYGNPVACEKRGSTP